MSSYLVIARKWRPALFDEIVGQAHVTRTLVNAITSGRISHAYLFSGPRGVGKTTAARILAKGLNCSGGPTPTPCNECSSCTSIANGSSVDVFEIDGASNTSVENVRELRESVRFMPSQGRFKVYIIDEVHMLSTSAFNALLKTLEEPPPHTVFIFATTEVHKIPLTIISRCQRFDFKRIPLKDIEGHLRKIATEEGIAVTEDALFTIAREADGSLRDAQSLLDHVLAFADGEITDLDVTEALGLLNRTILFELLESMVARDGLKGLNIVEKIYDFGYDLKRACSELLGGLRDLMVIKVSKTEGGAIDAGVLDLSEHEFERMERVAADVGVERLHMLFNIISLGYEEVSRSAYPRYSFEMALLKAAHFDEVQSVAGLLERLERLGAGLTGPGGPGGGHETAREGKGIQGHGVSWSGPQKAAPVQGAGGGHVGHGGQAGRSKGPAVVEKEACPGVKTAAAEVDSAYEAVPTDPSGTGGLVDHIRRKIPSLAGPLKFAEIKVDGGEIGITVSAEKCQIFKMKDKQIEDICREYLREDGLKLRINVLAGSGIDKEMRTDTLVEEALRIFGGKVIGDGGRTNV